MWEEFRINATRNLYQNGPSYQLLQVVLYRVRVNHDADGHQRVEGKVKYLVAEKWDNPGRTQLKQRCPEFHYNRPLLFN